MYTIPEHDASFAAGARRGTRRRRPSSSPSAAPHPPRTVRPTDAATHGPSHPAFTLACGLDRTGAFTIHVQAASASVLLTGSAAVLILLLARAHVGPDRQPRWTTVGDVLREVGRTAPGLFNRRSLDALVADVRRALAGQGIPATLLETDDDLGLRLAAWPERIDRASRRGARTR